MPTAGAVDVAECVQRQLDEVDAMRAVFGDDRVEVDPTEATALLESWLSALRPAGLPTTTACHDGSGQPWPAAASSEGSMADCGHAAASLEGAHHNSADSVMGLPPCELQFTVWLEHRGGHAGCRFRCPHNYPASAPPIVSVDVAAGGVGALSKAHEAEFASALRTAAANAYEVGEECAFQIAQDAEAALENILASSSSSSSLVAPLPSGTSAASATAATMTAPAHGTSAGGVSPPITDARGAVGRRLLWSHHIKSTTKKKHIVNWARDLGVTVICKPGCVRCTSCAAFNATLRHLI
jgi:hypothetical protein